MMHALLFVAATFVGGEPIPPPPPPPVVVVTPAPAAATPGRPGHYTCDPGDRCHLDDSTDPGPNPGSDVPADTLAGRDAAYSAANLARYCAALPWNCGDPYQ